MGCSDLSKSQRLVGTALDHAADGDNVGPLHGGRFGVKPEKALPTRRI